MKFQLIRLKVMGNFPHYQIRPCHPKFLKSRDPLFKFCLISLFSNGKIYITFPQFYLNPF